MKDDCIFCTIANGLIPSYTLYEDADFRVIFDIGPASEGHALILPKEHSGNLLELSDESAAKVLPLAKRAARLLSAETGCEGVNVVQNNGRIAGQTVFHFHMHIIPRYRGDQVNITWKPGKVDEEKAKVLAEKIREAWSRA